MCNTSTAEYTAKETPSSDGADFPIVGSVRHSEDISNMSLVDKNSSDNEDKNSSDNEDCRVGRDEVNSDINNSNNMGEDDGDDIINGLMEGMPLAHHRSRQSRVSDVLTWSYVSVLVIVCAFTTNHVYRRDVAFSVRAFVDVAYILDPRHCPRHYEAQVLMPLTEFSWAEEGTRAEVDRDKGKDKDKDYKERGIKRRAGSKYTTRTNSNLSLSTLAQSLKCVRTNQVTWSLAWNKYLMPRLTAYPENVTLVREIANTCFEGGLFLLATDLYMRAVRMDTAQQKSPQQDRADRMREGSKGNLLYRALDSAVRAEAAYNSSLFVRLHRKGVGETGAVNDTSAQLAANDVDVVAINNALSMYGIKNDGAHENRRGRAGVDLDEARNVFSGNILRAETEAASYRAEYGVVDVLTALRCELFYRGAAIREAVNNIPIGDVLDGKRKSPPQHLLPELERSEDLFERAMRPSCVIVQDMNDLSKDKLDGGLGLQSLAAGLSEPKNETLAKFPVLAIHAYFNKLEGVHRATQATIEKYRIGPQGIELNPSKKGRKARKKKMKLLRSSSERQKT